MAQDFMEQKEFMNLVAELRANQKAFFKTRDQVILNRCKSLEKKVDAAIANYQNPNKQTALF